MIPVKAQGRASCQSKGYKRTMRSGEVLEQAAWEGRELLFLKVFKKRINVALSDLA